MQVGNLRDGDASGCELGCGDVYFFDLYLPRFDRSVANHYKCEQSHDSQRHRFVQGPIEIEQRGECMAEVKYQANAKKQEQISHPRCLLYTSDAADDLLCVDLGGRRII